MNEQSSLGHFPNHPRAAEELENKHYNYLNEVFMCLEHFAYTNLRMHLELSKEEGKKRPSKWSCISTLKAAIIPNFRSNYAD